MPDRLPPALGLMLVLATASLSACGGGGASSASKTASVPVPSTSASTTKPQFAARAQAICSALSAHELPLKARQESLRGLPTATADKTFVSLARQVVALSSAANGKLRALPVPAADARQIKTLLAAFSEEIADASNIATAAAAEENTTGEEAAGSIRRLIAAYRASASAYGMKDCIGSE